MEDYDRCLNARPKETCLISIFQGTSGKKNWNNYWLQENAKKRKTMMDKWLKDPASVGDASTSGGEVTLRHTFSSNIKFDLYDTRSRLTSSRTVENSWPSRFD